MKPSTITMMKKIMTMKTMITTIIMKTMTITIMTIMTTKITTMTMIMKSTITTTITATAITPMRFSTSSAYRQLTSMMLSS